MNTIILQGSIAKIDQVQKCINSIRIWFDGKIILSFWNDELNLLQNLFDYDEAVALQDPGAGPFNGLYPVEQHCNLKRQIFGLNGALQKCENGLVLKIRNDCLLTKNIFKIFQSKKCSGNLCIFKNKIMVGNLMTINPDTLLEKDPFFRISDWFYLGNKNDLLKICQIYDEIEKEDYSNTFFGTEHILAFNLIKYFILKDLKIEDLRNISHLSWDYIINNFIVVDTFSTAGIKNIGKWSNQPEYLSCYLTEKQYNEKLKEIL